MYTPHQILFSESDVADHEFIVGGAGGVLAGIGDERPASDSRAFAAEYGFFVERFGGQIPIGQAQVGDAVIGQVVIRLTSLGLLLSGVLMFKYSCS